MTGCEIAEKLRQLNRWRRGDDEALLMPDPAAIGRWIDAAADALELRDNRAARVAELEAALRDIVAWVDEDGADEKYDREIQRICFVALASADSATPADPFPCRSDPLRKGTDYKAAPAKQGGVQ